jgi:serine protease
MRQMASFAEATSQGGRKARPIPPSVVTRVASSLSGLGAVVALAAIVAPPAASATEPARDEAGRQMEVLASSVWADRTEPTRIVTTVRVGDDLEFRTVIAQDEGDVLAGLTAAEADGAILGVEVDVLGRIDTAVVASAPNDTRYPDQWGLATMGLDTSTWAASGGGANVIVGVIDSGVRVNHEDLAGRVLAARDMIAEPSVSTTTDTNGHGTHVAGTIAANAGNLVGGAGVAPSASIVSATVCGSTGLCWGSDVAQGITWAVDQGATVINLSLGFTSPSFAVQNAVSAAIADGVIVVAAAGNGGENQVIYPAGHPGVIGVGAHTQSGAVASFSQRGDHVDVVAPGWDVLSTSNASASSYEWMTGTSMATPHVAGLAALLRSSQPAATAGQVTSAIMSSAADIAPAGPDISSGSGRVRAPEALNALAALTSPVTPTPPTPRSGSASPAPRAGLVGPNGPIVIVDGQVQPNGSAGSAPAGTQWAATAQTASGAGAWTVDTMGRIVTSGDAGNFGDLGQLGITPNRPINAMAPTPSGRGYWMGASDGGMFSFGDAAFFGSMGGRPLNQPIVGMASTPSGRGYWLVAADGGIFSFGDAAFYGSTGSLALNRPINGMASTPSGRGYWLFATDGGIFSFGDAAFYGALPGVPGAAGKTAVGMLSTPSGNGYWIVTNDNAVYAFGDA